MGCFNSKEAKTGDATELNSRPAAANTSTTAQTAPTSTGGATSGTAVGGTTAGAGNTSTGTTGQTKFERAQRNKENPIVYFDMEQGGKSLLRVPCACEPGAS